MNHLGRPIKIYEVNPIGRAETFNMGVKFREAKSTATEQEVASGMDFTLYDDRRMQRAKQCGEPSSRFYFTDEPLRAPSGRFQPTYHDVTTMEKVQ